MEELALELASSIPSLWKQYEDDTSCILRKGDVDGRATQSPKQHTAHYQLHHGVGGVGVPPLPGHQGHYKLANDKLDITVYCKRMHTDRYRHFESHHPIHMKKGTVRCLYDQARKLTQRNESLKEEESHLMTSGMTTLEPLYDQLESLTTLKTTKPRSF